MADWDRYRWKVSHAVEQFNKASAEVQSGISSAPCDTWVRVWAKYEYLASRIAKLRVSIEAVRATLDACDEWLNSVEQDYTSKGTQIKTMYDKDVAQLKLMQVHDTCSDTKCMFKRGQWTSKGNVPTSSLADFFIKASSTTLDVIADDPIGDAVDAATS